jgi:hypothetical protein
MSLVLTVKSVLTELTLTTFVALGASTRNLCSIHRLGRARQTFYGLPWSRTLWSVADHV